MKMPSRPYFPPTEPVRDIFGLTRLSLLCEGLESDAERASRVATVEKGVQDAFQAAIDHLGEQEARKLFAKVTRRPKRKLR
jgi:hypothetical protein